LTAVRTRAELCCRQNRRDYLVAAKKYEGLLVVGE
jgi:hypothetical protein